MARFTKTKAAPAQKRPSGLMVVLAFAAAVAAAVGLVVGALVLRNDGDDARPTSSTPVVDVTGIPQDGRILGSPDANVTLIEYADLQCPACRAYTELAFPTVVDAYVRPGRVNVEFRGLAFIGPDSEKALRLVLAAGLQDRLWQLQEALYRNQQGENSGWVTDDLVRELAGDIDGLEVERLFADAESDEVSAMITEDAAAGAAAEVRGTPTLLAKIGDAEPYKLEAGISASEVAAALDDALAG